MLCMNVWVHLRICSETSLKSDCDLCFSNLKGDDFQIPFLMIDCRRSVCGDDLRGKNRGDRVMSFKERSTHIFWGEAIWIGMKSGGLRASYGLNCAPAKIPVFKY